MEPLEGIKKNHNNKVRKKYYGTTLSIKKKGKNQEKKLKRSRNKVRFNLKKERKHALDQESDQEKK